MKAKFIPCFADMHDVYEPRPLRLQDVEMGVVTEQLAVAACVRLQPQNMEDELRNLHSKKQ